MRPERMAAFSDGVFAVIITIVVLELPVPHGGTIAALGAGLPILAAYALSFVIIGLYWNNHHHMLLATERIDGGVLWANLFMLFWLSLMPWVIRWIDEAGFIALPVACYGLIFGLAGVGYLTMQTRIVRLNGAHSLVARAIGHDRKGKASLVIPFVGAAAALWQPWLAIALYVGLSLWWFLPDRRIERTIHEG